MATFYPSGGKSYTLNASISSTATSITLTSFTVPVTGTLLTMAVMNTSIAYGTIQPKTSSAEFISFTGITANADGTATLTGVTRGLDKNYPYTTVAGFKLPHSGQSSFILSDAPQVFNKYASTDNANSWADIQTFVVSPIAPVPTTSTQVATKGYVDGVAIAGAPDSSTTVKGIGKLSTAPVSGTNPIFVGDNDTRISTQGENDAQVGNNTDIAVGTGNKFVTQTGLQHNAEKYAADGSGSSTAYTVTLSPVPTSYTNGMIFYVKIGLANTTTTPTLNVNGLGAKTIVKSTSTALIVGDIAANMFCTFIYDGTNVVLQNPTANTPSAITKYTSFILTRNLATATGTVNQAHGLGKIPSFIEVESVYVFASNSLPGSSNGCYNGTSQTAIFTYQIAQGSGSVPTTGADTTNTINIGTTTTNLSNAIVTYDATNVIFNWTLVNSSANTINILLKVYA